MFSLWLGEQVCWMMPVFISLVLVPSVCVPRLKPWGGAVGGLPRMNPWVGYALEKKGNTLLFLYTFLHFNQKVAATDISGVEAAQDFEGTISVHFA